MRNYENTIKEQVLETITHGVRFLSVEQIAREWYAGDIAATTRLVATLEEEELVSRETLLAHPELEVRGPEFCWLPGAGFPDFRPVAYRLRHRWSEQKQMVEVILPEKRACEQYGGTRIRPRRSEISHDLHFAAVYLKVRPVLPSTLTWVAGDTLRSSGGLGEVGGTVPDAVLISPGGEIQKILEGGGSYPRSKLETIHQAYQRTPYEIW